MRCMIQETEVIRSVPKVQIRNHQEETTDEKNIFFPVFLNRSGLTTARPDRVVC